MFKDQNLRIDVYKQILAEDYRQQVLPFMKKRQGIPCIGTVKKVNRNRWDLPMRSHLTVLMFYVYGPKFLMLT